MQGQMNEDSKLQAIDKMAEQYYERYRNNMDALEQSLNCSIKKDGLDANDVFALGSQLEKFENFVEMCEEVGNTNLLGTLPKIGMDVITAVHGSSIIPVVASVQPIEEESGLVWFKTVRSENTRGSQTAGDVVRDPRTGTVYPQGYASGRIQNEQEATSGAQFTYSFTLSFPPIRSESLRLELSQNSDVFARDVGPQGADKNIGTLLGAGVSGTVNYTTGQVDVEFTSDPGAGNMVMEYQQNFERSSDIPQIQNFFDSKQVRAHPYTLKATFGMIQDFTMRKRFGFSAQDSLSEDLVTEINKEVGGDLIRLIDAVKLGSENFDASAPSGVSFFEHKQTYKDVLARATTNLINNAGRGQISVLIAGLDHTAIIQTLPGFQRVSDGSALGTQVIGTLDGMTVVQVKDTNLLATNRALAIWKGPTPFEAPAVWSPFMPLATTGTLPESPNPLVSMKAGAVVGAVESLVPQFATEITISNAP